MRSTTVVATCLFNNLLGAGLFPALDGTSMRTDPSTSERKYRKLVNNAVFIRNESLFVVSAAAKSAFKLKHTPRLLRVRSICPAAAGYQIPSRENVSHVALREVHVLLACIRGIRFHIGL